MRSSARRVPVLGVLSVRLSLAPPSVQDMLHMGPRSYGFDTSGSRGGRCRKLIAEMALETRS